MRGWFIMHRFLLTEAQPGCPTTPRVAVCCGSLLVLAVLCLTPAGAWAERTLTMTEAVNIALRDSPRIAASAAGAMAAGEGVKAKRGTFGPALGTSYTYTANDHPISSSVGQQQSLWSVALKQNLFSGFKNLAEWQKAALEHEHETASVRATQLAVVQLVQEHYLAYLQARENIRSASDALQRLQSQLRVTTAFFQEGLRPRLDVLQAEVDASRAEAILIQAENTMSTEAARLNTLLNLPVQESVTYTGVLDPIPFEPGLEPCLERAYRQRPDLRMAALAVDIAGKDRTAVQSGYYPRLDAELNWNSRGDGLSASGGLPQRTTNQGVALTADWTLFDWGQTWYADKQAGFTQTRMRAQAADLHQEVAYEIKSRLLMARDAEKRIAVALKAVTQAREAYNVAVARYQSQVGTNTDVLDAQAKLTLEEAGLTGARAEYLSALARLFAAMGEIHAGLDEDTALVVPTPGTGRGTGTETGTGN